VAGRAQLSRRSSSVVRFRAETIDHFPRSDGDPDPAGGEIPAADGDDDD